MLIRQDIGERRHVWASQFSCEKMYAVPSPKVDFFCPAPCRGYRPGRKRSQIDKFTHLSDVEQLRHDRGDATKERRPRAPLQLVSIPLHLHERPLFARPQPAKYRSDTSPAPSAQIPRPCCVVCGMDRQGWRAQRGARGRAGACAGTSPGPRAVRTARGSRRSTPRSNRFRGESGALHWAVNTECVCGLGKWTYRGRDDHRAAHPSSEQSRRISCPRTLCTSIPDTPGWC